MQGNSRKRQFSFGKLLPSRPFVFLGSVYSLSMLFFACLRFFFLLNFSDRVYNATFVEILQAFVVGARFDQIIVLYILLPLVIILPWVSMRLLITRISVAGYLAVMFSFVFFLSLADIRFYSYFESHLNFLAYEYIGEGSTFWNQVTADPKFFTYIFLWLALSALFTVLMVMAFRTIRSIPGRRAWIGQIIWSLVFVALSFIGIRGRTGLAPIDWGAAYFSQNQFLNQLALNGVYVLGRNMSERDGDLRLSTRGESERFPFVELSVATDTVRAMLHQTSDEWTEGDDCLQRITRQDTLSIGYQPNVIVVLMESWSARHTGILGCSHDLTPNFDQLASDGILFTDFYASGTRTSFGLPAVLGSFPSLPGRSIMGRYDARHPFVTLSEILHHRGYFNVFAYGGDLVFDNMEGFFKAKKYDRICGENWFGRENAFSKWGIPDHVLFDKTTNLIQSLPRPFQLTILTLSNHEPYDLPDSSVQQYFDDDDSSKIFNAQLYADFAFGRFVRDLRSSAILDSTIVVFTADHARYGAGRSFLDPEIFRAPLLIYAPSILGGEGYVVSKVGSQTDIISTVMGILGGDYEHASWGRDLLKLTDDDPGFAFMNVADRSGFIEGEYLYTEWLGRCNEFYDDAMIGDPDDDLRERRIDDFLRLQRRMRIFMQVAEHMSLPLPL